MTSQINQGQLSRIKSQFVDIDESDRTTLEKNIFRILYKKPTARDIQNLLHDVRELIDECDEIMDADSQDAIMNIIVMIEDN